MIRGRLLLRIGNAYALDLGAAPARCFDRPVSPDFPAGCAGTAPYGNGAQLHRGSAGAGHALRCPAGPLFLIAVYLMHVGLGHAMLFGMIVLLVLTWLTEALTGNHLRAAGEASIHAQRHIDNVVQNSEAVEAMEHARRNVRLPGMWRKGRRPNQFGQ